jgi:hypothetical protein
MDLGRAGIHEKEIRFIFHFSQSEREEMICIKMRAGQR